MPSRTPPSTSPPPAGVRVTLRYFAVLRERRGREEEELEIRPGTSVAELYAALFPAGPEGRLPVACAVDRAYVTGDHRLQGGEEVVFVPPLGGG